MVFSGGVQELTDFGYFVPDLVPAVFSIVKTWILTSSMKYAKILLLATPVILMCLQVLKFYLENLSLYLCKEAEWLMVNQGTCPPIAEVIYGPHEPNSFPCQKEQ